MGYLNLPCRSSLIFCMAIFFASLTLGQSLDDVHSVPRRTPKAPAVHDDQLGVHAKPLSVDIDLVRVPVVVTDSNGTPVMDLGKRDFQLLEAEREQEIRYFYSEDAPISVGLIVDVSGSMANKIDRVREAVDEFFKIADPRDDYFVITFSNKPQLFANTTQSTETIESKLAGMQAKGDTALADAIFMGVKKLHNAQYSRKALVVISDGGDNMSRHTLHSVKHMARESDAQIYAIDVCDSPDLLFTKKLEEKFGRQWLTQVTEQTGGRTIAVDTASKIPDAASQVSSELRNQYVLAYRPSDGQHDGKWRKLKVRVTREPNPLPYQIYYRTGYLARKD